MCPLRLTTEYSSSPESNVSTLTLPCFLVLVFPPDKMADILRAALAFSVITSFFIRNG